MLTLFLVYLLCGAGTGIIAGLLGVGGGVVIVPMLSLVFAWQHFPPDLLQHMALGTSMATIMFTSVSSFRAHHKRGAVRWDIWRSITPGIVVGTLLGASIAAYLSSDFLKIFFVCFLFLAGTQMLMNFKPKPTRQLPSKLGIASVGSGIGFISSFAGVGGGLMSVPFMAWCNVPLHSAVGTSAAIGLPIAVAGTVGYLFTGYGAEGLPAYSLGFVSLPALVGLVIPSMLTAPFGARISHALPVDRLKRFFGIFIYIMAFRMLWGVL